MRRRYKFERVYWNCYEWEEMQHNMWGSVKCRSQFLTRAIDFTGNHNLYGSYMMRVVNEWPISCENALTDYSLNRKAWVGHAACALALQCPEDITREAWGYLTDEQRALANRQAAAAIGQWEDNYASSIGICQNVDEPMLPGWDSRHIA